MKKYTRFSARASLAAVGVRMQQMKIWKSVERHVDIKQKAIKYKPLEKLSDAFINILSGGQGMVEINTRVRPDQALSAENFAGPAAFPGSPHRAPAIPAW